MLVIEQLMIAIDFHNYNGYHQHSLKYQKNEEEKLIQQHGCE